MLGSSWQIGLEGCNVVALRDAHADDTLLLNASSCPVKSLTHQPRTG